MKGTLEVLEEVKAALAQRNSEVEELKMAYSRLDSWNQEWQRQHQSLMASLPDAGQWKMLYPKGSKVPIQ